MREEKKTNKRSQSWRFTHRNGIAFNAQTCTRSVAHEKEFVSRFSNSRRTHWRQTVNRTDKTVVCWVNSRFHNQADSPVSKSARYSCSCLCEHIHRLHTRHTTISIMPLWYMHKLEMVTMCCDRNICFEHTLWMKIPFSIWKRQWRPRHMHIHTVSITIVKHAIDTYFELVPFHCVYPMFFHARRLYLCVCSIVLMCSFMNIRFPFSPFIIALALSVRVYMCMCTRNEWWIFLPLCDFCACIAPYMYVCVRFVLREPTVSYYIFMKISGSSSVSQTNLGMKHTNSETFVCMFSNLSEETINNTSRRTHDSWSSYIARTTSNSSLVSSVFHLKRLVFNRLFLLLLCASSHGRCFHFSC